jgi:hypothetical protein
MPKPKLNPFALALRALMLASLAKDPRPVVERDQHQKKRGKKRTTIAGVELEPTAGADLPTKDVDLNNPSDMGRTRWGIMTWGALLREAVLQGQLLDCYLLAAILGIIQVDPLFFDDVFEQIDDKTVVVKYVIRGYVIRIKVTLEVSIEFNNPNDNDIRVELIEKTYGFARRTVESMHAADWGNGTEAGMAWGLTTTKAVQSAERTPAFVDAIHRRDVTPRSGWYVTLLSASSATLIAYSHAYTTDRFKFASLLPDNVVLINPWAGAADCVVPVQAIRDPKQFAAIYYLFVPPPAQRVLKSPPRLVRLTGDANGDGHVDFSDFTVLSQNYGRTTTATPVGQRHKLGDFNEDGVVDFSDFVLLSRNYATHAGNMEPLPANFPPKQEETPVAVKLEITSPTFAPGATHATVTGKPGTAVALELVTDAESVTMTTPRSSPHPVALTNGAHKGWISTIGQEPLTVTVTARRGAETTARTITLAPSAPVTEPKPVRNYQDVRVFFDGRAPVNLP